MRRSFCGSTQWRWVEEKDVTLAGEETGHIGRLEAVGQECGLIGSWEGGYGMVE